jgi:HAD superfamily hydrolase (TIGR01549 family)
VTAAAWLVDLDGTLYHPRPVQLLAGIDLLLAGPSTVRIVRAFRREHERMRAEGTAFAPDPFRAQVARTATRLGTPPEAVDRIARRWMVERPSRWLRAFRRRRLLAAIQGARAQGVRLALVSDYPASIKLERLGARALFDVVVASGEPDGPSHLKPHPEGFLLAAERLGVSPPRCLVIGDRPDADGAAAHAAGMQFQEVGRGA